MLTHQGNVPVARVQHLEYYAHLSAVIVLFAEEVFSLSIPAGPATHKQTIIDVGACPLPHVGSLKKVKTPLLVVGFFPVTQHLWGSSECFLPNEETEFMAQKKILT